MSIRPLGPRCGHGLSRFWPRRNLQTQSFQPFVPPPPGSLPKPAPPKRYPRLLKHGRRLLYLGIITGTAYGIDKQFNYSALTRSFRSFWTGLVIATDYKINFRENPPFAKSIPDLHNRSAQRIYELLRENGGLYLKIGQAIAMQSAVLPPEFQEKFAKFFDDAPQNGWTDVDKVIREDFGKSPEELFGVSFTGEEGKGLMERKARASASVAQVHWARLQDGREVAIKIQKKEIAAQVGWDLWSFKVIMYLFTRAFDLPLYSVVPFMIERLQAETDFEIEASNSENMARLVAGEPRLNGRVYIPKVYRELSSKRVMTAEWIEGVRLWDKTALTSRWKGGSKGSPGVHGTLLESPTTLIPQEELRHQAIDSHLKPERNAWRGRDGKGGLGVSLKKVMTTMVDLFSAQMFLWGSVHCDPHPGNIFIRRLPSGEPELVLIDHGLYITLSTELRHKYSLFWKSLLAFDNVTLGHIAEDWGVKNPDLFASATLMRPYTGGNDSTSKYIKESADKKRTTYEHQTKMRQGLKDVLSDENKWPRELLFLGRNLRIVQGNNAFLGSPVNRVKITGLWASRALTESPDLPLGERLGNLGRHLIFRTVLFSSDIIFWISRVRQFFGLGQGMEDDLEQSMRKVAKDSFGVELNHGLFDG